MKMKTLAAKFVPRVLTDKQREPRVETCHALLELLETNPNFSSKVTVLWLQPRYKTLVIPIEDDIALSSKEMLLSQTWYRSVHQTSWYHPVHPVKKLLNVSSVECVSRFPFPFYFLLSHSLPHSACSI